MRRLIGISLLLVLTLVLGSVSFANLNDFTGTWVNVTPNNGITKVVIASSGSNVTVQAWGACSPSDCDWGTVNAIAYGSSISSALPASAIALSAEFNYSGINNLLVIKKSGNQLQVQDLTTYNDGRSSRYSTYTFNRNLQLLGPIFTPGTIKPIGLATPQQYSPANGTVFGHYPRTTTLKWNAVSGAASYTVEIDCFHCCQNNAWCSDVGQTWKVVPGLTGTYYTFDFVGAQPGRWRVWAVGSGGQESAKSGWWEFKYTQ